MATAAQLVEALLEFPVTERADAARALLESLDGEDEDDPIAVEIAWREETVRRAQEIETGAVALMDGPTAMSRLRAKAQARRNRRP